MAYLIVCPLITELFPVKSEVSPRQMIEVCRLMDIFIVKSWFWFCFCCYFTWSLLTFYAYIAVVFSDDINQRWAHPSLLCYQNLYLTLPSHLVSLTIIFTSAEICNWKLVILLQKVFITWFRFHIFGCSEVSEILSYNAPISSYLCNYTALLYNYTL